MVSGGSRRVVVCAIVDGWKRLEKNNIRNTRYWSEVLIEQIGFVYIVVGQFIKEHWTVMLH